MLFLIPFIKLVFVTDFQLCFKLNWLSDYRFKMAFNTLAVIKVKSFQTFTGGL